MLRKIPFLFVALAGLLSAIAFALAAVDLNSATESELENLPGVGPKIAHNIVNARPFRSIEDLRNVKGIGDKEFAKLAPLVTAAPVATTAPTPTETRPIPAQQPMNTGATGSSASEESTTRTTVVHHRKAALMANERININTASKADLERLPGIGAVKAERIIAARPFNSPQDLLKVKGIKAKTFAKLRDNITVQ